MQPCATPESRDATLRLASTKVRRVRSTVTRILMGVGPPLDKQTFWDEVFPTIQARMRGFKSKDVSTKLKMRYVTLLRELHRLEQPVAIIHPNSATGGVFSEAVAWLWSCDVWDTESAGACEHMAFCLKQLGRGVPLIGAKQFDVLAGMQAFRTLMRRRIHCAAHVLLCEYTNVLTHLDDQVVCKFGSKLPTLCNDTLRRIIESCANEAYSGMMADYVLSFFNVMCALYARGWQVRETRRTSNIRKVMDSWLRQNQFEYLLNALTSFWPSYISGWFCKPFVITAAMDLVTERAIALHRGDATLQSLTPLFAGINSAQKFLSSINDMEEVDIHSIRNFCIMAMAVHGGNGNGRMALSTLAHLTGQKRLGRLLFPATIFVTIEPDRLPTTFKYLRTLPDGLAKAVAAGVQDAMVTIGLTGLDFETVELWAEGSVLQHLPRKRPRGQTPFGACIRLPQECPVCMESKRPAVVMAPCGHVFCALCRPEVMGRCHVCKTPVTGDIQRVFS